MRAECKNCGGPVGINHSGPCPHCGRTAGKTVYKDIPITSTGKVSMSWERTREFWTVNRTLLIFLIIITLYSPFVGLLISGAWGVGVSLVLSVLAFLVGPFAIGKMRDVLRGGV